MKNLCAIFLIGLCLACSESQESRKSNAKVENKATKQVEKKEVNLQDILLDNQNVTEVLTKYGEQNPETVVLISTRLGDIKVKLYKETPLHRANFIRLAKKKYFDGTVFHRVIQDFIVQGGGFDTPRPSVGKYTIPSEIKPEFIHKRGALAMAREYENNPEKRSAFHDFYIVQTKKMTLPELQASAKEHKIKLTPLQINTYTTLGGAPHLDNQHTVFGEVVAGMDVVDRIAAVKTDKGGWPIEDVVIKMTVIE
ncbi:peptidylprolyl isomerase [Thermoflexibacter ruber]|uniref:peptidylprolyl isomerase n=1 Tax=Thermoflexibacter ruber TaxID=1003 RepID=A0A1I2IR30_9BACT|nr:peptidylprolyl isomerase [Thermoflexibacter ruber]SFF44734.1 peptidyl-prolyl cis-trans isomerase B (cyclophilin B) [Thermoflexibacter ruber]